MSYINNIEGYELEPMTPSEENRGGIYATTVEDTTNMVEVGGFNGKAYVDALSVDIGGEF